MSTSKNTTASAKHYLTALAGVLAGFTSASAYQGFMSQDLWIGVAAIASAALFAFLASLLFDSYEATLTARVMDEADFDWDVSMNGVNIGRIADSQYAAIQRHALRDRHLVVAQALNVGAVIANILTKVIVGAPVVAFWSLVALSFSTRTHADQFTQAGTVVNLHMLFESFRFLTPIAIIVVAIWILAAVVTGRRFGFKNRYAESVSRTIRQQCNTPTDGAICLSKTGKVNAAFAST